MLIALAAPAWATCVFTQNPTPEGVHVVIEAREEPVGCRDVTLTASTPISFTARVVTPEGRSRRLPADHQLPVAGGGWILSAPELEVGGRLDLDVEVAGDDLTVALSAVPAPLPRGTRIDEVRTFQLDARHPAWGFADPKKGRTHVEVRLRVDTDAGEQMWPLPQDAELVDTGGLRAGAGAVWAPAGSDTTVRYTVPGAAPFGREWIGPGSLSLRCPACVPPVGTGSEGVSYADGVFDAPAGGEVRWRIPGTADGATVVADTAQLLAGLEWRFARASLPEPAVPMRLKGMTDRRALVEALYDEVWALTDAAIAGRDPLRPRQLNRAWRSGWVTPVERGLILQRMLAQEKIPARIVLTGRDPDPVTGTGLDAVLVLATVEGAPIWLDPTCSVCAPGQVSTRWMGRWALGGATEVPRAPGRLERRTAVTGDGVTVQFRAEGAAARWIREELADTDAAQRPARLATLLGMRGATSTRSLGLGEAEGPVEVALRGDSAPRDPFGGRPTPWEGGIVDAAPEPDPPPAP